MSANAFCRSGISNYGVKVLRDYLEGWTKEGLIRAGYIKEDTPIKDRCIECNFGRKGLCQEVDKCLR